jgi:Ner family transcriptional regulator
MAWTSNSYASDGRMPTGDGMSEQRRGWHPEDVKAAIRKRGVGLYELSRRHGYVGAAIGIALRRPWPRLERIIADFIGVPPQEIWPDRYDAQGRSIVRSRPGRTKFDARPRSTVRRVRASKRRSS